MKTSNLFSINLNDLGKGFIVAVGTAVVAVVEKSLDAGTISLNYKQIGLTALAAGVAYLSKNFFTPAKLVNKAQ